MSKHVGSVRRPEEASGCIGRGGETINKLCFKCIYATGGCEWADEFKPVPGWVAEKGKYDGWAHIIECPKFEEGDRVWSSKKRVTKRNAKGSLNTSKSSDG